MNKRDFKLEQVTPATIRRETKLVNSLEQALLQIATNDADTSKVAKKKKQHSLS